MGGLVMDVNARFKMSKAYFHAFWNDWMVTRGLWQRYANVCFGVIVMLIGVVSFLRQSPFFPSKLLLVASLMVIAVGAGLFAWHFLYPHIWVRRMLRDTDLDKDHSWRFSPHEITIKGPHSESCSTWESVKGITIAPNGMFLRLARGIFAYIPDDAFVEAEGKNIVIQMYRDAQDEN